MRRVRKTNFFSVRMTTENAAKLNALSEAYLGAAKTKLLERGLELVIADMRANDPSVAKRYDALLAALGDKEE